MKSAPASARHAFLAESLGVSRRTLRFGLSRRAAGANRAGPVRAPRAAGIGSLSKRRI